MPFPHRSLPCLAAGGKFQPCVCTCPAARSQPQTPFLPSRPACRKGRNFVYVHIQPQYECLITESGGWAVDFIGRVESIDDDLRLVLAEIERRREAGAPPVRCAAATLCTAGGGGLVELGVVAWLQGEEAGQRWSSW